MFLPSVLPLLVLAALPRLGHARHLVHPRSDGDLSNDLNPITSYQDDSFSNWVKIILPPREVVDQEMGTHVELECEAMGSPPPIVGWARDKTPITPYEEDYGNVIPDLPSQALAKVRTRLVINHLLDVHRGQYRCVAQSGSQMAVARTTVAVTGGNGESDKFFENQIFNNYNLTKYLGEHHVPRISLWATTYFDLIGSNLVLPCRTYGNPKPTQMWLDPSNKVVRGGGRITMLPEGELRIRGLRWEDMGVYKCVARNMIGTDTVETFVYPLKDSN